MDKPEFNPGKLPDEYTGIDLALTCLYEAREKLEAEDGIHWLIDNAINLLEEELDEENL